MLYILSGASSAGKTNVAKAFLERTGIPYMSVDAIMMGFTNGIPDYGVHDRLWPDEIAQKLWPFYKAMCDNMIWSQVDYLLEGEAFLPVNLRHLVDKNPANVKVAFMGYGKANLSQKIQDVETYSGEGRNWLIEEPEEHMESHIQNMIQYSAMIEAECAKHRLPYFDMSCNFQGSVQDILNYLSLSSPPRAE